MTRTHTGTPPPTRPLVSSRASPVGRPRRPEKLPVRIDRPSLLPYGLAGKTDTTNLHRVVPGRTLVTSPHPSSTVGRQEKSQPNGNESESNTPAERRRISGAQKTMKAEKNHKRVGYTYFRRSSPRWCGRGSGYRYVPQKDRFFGPLGMFSKKPVRRVGMEEAKTTKQCRSFIRGEKEGCIADCLCMVVPFSLPPPSFFLFSCTYLSQSSA